MAFMVLKIIFGFSNKVIIKLTVHLCGFSPVWRLMCTTSIYWALNGFSSREQSSHRQMNDFLFAWIWSLLMCLTNSSCVLNSNVQSRQWQFVSTKSPGSSLRSVVSAAATDSPLMFVVDGWVLGRLGSRLIRFFLWSMLEGLSASTVVTCEWDKFFSCFITVEGGVVSRWNEKFRCKITQIILFYLKRHLQFSMIVMSVSRSALDGVAGRTCC